MFYRLVYDYTVSSGPRTIAVQLQKRLQNIANALISFVRWAEVRKVLDTDGFQLIERILHGWEFRFHFFQYQVASVCCAPHFNNCLMGTLQLALHHLQSVSKARCVHL